MAETTETERASAQLARLEDDQEAEIYWSTEDMLALRHLISEARRVGQAREKLTIIAEGSGPFSRDPLTFAGNVIEALKATARDGLALLSAPDTEGRA